MNNFCILIIDDERETRTMLSMVLNIAGYHVLTANNGNEGIDMFIQNQIDLIITDIIMPEKDGVETIREIRKISDSIKIIALTGKTTGINSLKDAKSINSDCTFTKPVNMDKLRSKIKDFLEPKRENADSHMSTDIHTEQNPI